MCDKNANELRKRYEELIRHLMLREISQIEKPGPLSDHAFTRVRQEAYREWLAASSGVIYATNPDDLTHHPA